MEVEDYCWTEGGAGEIPHAWKVKVKPEQIKSLNDMDAGSERNERVDAWEQHVSKRYGRKYWFNKVRPRVLSGR